MQPGGIVWITGASSGIGEALARELAARGFKVAVSARSEAPLWKLAEAHPQRIFAFPADVSDAAAMAATAEKIEAHHGPIAAAVLNAGVYLPVDGLKPDIQLFRRSFEVNVMGTVHGLAALIPRMTARRAGRILIVSSVTGYGGLPTSAAYGATKAALINMAESLKFDLDKSGVSIGVVNPGFVKTPATDVNEFPMPFLMPVEAAARRLADGLFSKRFEITFPRRFTYMLKLLQLLPYPLYFALVRRMTAAPKPQ